MMTLLAGDFFVSRTPGHAAVSLAIRLINRRPGDPAWANHAGRVIRSGVVCAPECDEGLAHAEIVEAVWPKIRRVSLWDAYGPALGSKRPQVIVYRPLTTPMDHLDAIVAKTLTYVGHHYGWQALVWHLADTLLSKRAKKEVYIFRRLRFLPQMECSDVVARPANELGYDFGIPKDARANPDDLMDFAETHPKKYARVFGPAQIGA